MSQTPEHPLSSPNALRRGLSVENVTYQDVAKYLARAHELGVELEFRPEDLELARSAYLAARDLVNVSELLKKRLLNMKQNINPKTR